MAKRVLSMIWRRVAAGSSNLVGSSPSAITGKSSRGRVDRLNRARPATTCILPSAAVISTWLPSGSLRTMSNRVWAETVVAPGCVTLAGTLSSTCRSRSVAISRSDPSSRASISTLDRIGMVFLRSTTDWTWPRLFRSVARSIVAFIAAKPHHPHGQASGYSEPFAMRKWVDAESFIWRGEACPNARCCGLLAGFLADRRLLGGVLGRHQQRIDMVDDAVGELLVALGDRRLLAGRIGELDLTALLGRGQRSAAH